MGTSAGPDRRVLEYDVVNGVVTSHGAGASAVEQASIFEVLDRALAERAIEPPSEPHRGLLGGFVGYIGYECKADCGSPNVHRSDVPDAVLMLANRIVAVDQARSAVCIVAGGRQRARTAGDRGHGLRRET